MKKLGVIGLILLALSVLNYDVARGQMMGGGMMGGGQGMQMGQGHMAQAGQPAQRAMEDSALSRSNRQGAVNFKVSYLEKKGDELSFGVSMDTHSVDLDQYKMETISILKDDKDNQLKALKWDGNMGGGHHRSGVLIFPSKLPDGKEVMASGAKYVEVVIKGVDNVPERTFKWDLPLKR